MDKRDETSKPKIAPKKSLNTRLLVLVSISILLICLIAGGYFATRWYKNKKVVDVETKYQQVIKQVNDLNDGKKYSESEKIMENYLASKPPKDKELNIKLRLGAAYTNDKNYAKAQQVYDSALTDPNLEDGLKKGILAGLISIANRQNDKVAGEKYLVQIVALLDKMDKDAVTKTGKHSLSAQIEKSRFEQILASLRKQK